MNFINVPTYFLYVDLAFLRTSLRGSLGFDFFTFLTCSNHLFAMLILYSLFYRCGSFLFPNTLFRSYLCAYLVVVLPVRSPAYNLLFSRSAY